MARRELGERRRHLSFEELGLLKCRYGLSMQAWVHRARELDIIDDETLQLAACGVCEPRLAETQSHAEWHAGDEEPLRLKQLVLQAFAEGVITEERALELCPGCLSPQRH